MSKKIIALFFLILVAGGGFYFFNTYEKNHNASHITLYGNVDIRDVSLGARIFGRIEKMHFEEGDTIKKGDLVANLDQQPYEDELHAAKAALEEAIVAFENADRTYERKKKLKGNSFISTQELDDILSKRNSLQAKVSAAKAQLQNAQTNLDDAKIISPSAGIILTRVKEEGSIVQPGETIYVLALSEPIWVRAYVPEKELGRIHPGQQVKVYTDSRPQNPYEGQIGFISPVAEFTPKTVETPELRTQLVYRLRIIIQKPDKYLRQGMPVTARIESQ